MIEDPKEIKGSEDTRRLKGTNAKAKANATTETIGLLQYATNKRWQENFKSKHGTDAKYGWYRFTSRFALPVYSTEGMLEWWCLDWNKPSIDFYLSLGAEPMYDWTVYRIAGDTLKNLVK